MKCLTNKNEFSYLLWDWAADDGFDIQTINLKSQNDVIVKTTTIDNDIDVTHLKCNGT